MIAARRAFLQPRKPQMSDPGDSIPHSRSRNANPSSDSTRTDARRRAPSRAPGADGDAEHDLQHCLRHREPGQPHDQWREQGDSGDDSREGQRHHSEDRLARTRAGSGTQVRAVRVVPVAALDVEVEVAWGLEGHVGRRCAGRCAVPVPSARWIAHHVAGPNDVHAVLIGDGADAFDEHQVLAVVVLVRHGSRARAEVTAMEPKPGSAQGSSCTRTSSGWLNSDLSWPGTGFPLAPAVVPNSSMSCSDPCLGGLTETYPGEPPVHRLRRVDLAIDQGELVAIAGPPGPGKTTLLHLMVCHERGRRWSVGRHR